MRFSKEFFRYVLPSMLAFALSGIYAIADGFFVGNALGDNALAAINIAYPMTALLQAAGTGVGLGGAIEYAICMGAKDQVRGKQYFGMSLLVLLGTGALFTLVLLLCAPGLLTLFGASGEIHALGLEYIHCIAYGALFQVLATGLVPFIRNMGGSVTAMAAMMAGFVTNIALDYLFVWKLPFGMTGAAAATVIGQGVTFLVCLLFFLMKKEKPLLRFEGKGWTLFSTLLKAGISPFGLTFSPNLTLIFVNKSAVLFGGALAVTCYAPISYISAVVMLLLQGVSDGSQPLLSRSFGEGNAVKTMAVRRLAYGFSFLVGLVCMGVLFFCRNEAAALFGASQQVTQMVADVLPIFIWGYLCISVSRVTTAYFYATNQHALAAVLIYGEPVFLGLSLLLVPPLLGITGTWLSVLFSQAFAMGLSLVFILLERKRSGHATKSDSH